MFNKIKMFFTGKIIAFSLVVVLALTTTLLFVVWYFQPLPTLESTDPVLTLIPLPLPTSTLLVNDEQLPDGVEPTLVVIDGIAIGTVVQITGTEGAGLRLRSQPGINSSVQFLGDELELFQVTDGPVEGDGYVWWYLESPYDLTRSGWAASSYLVLITEQE